MAFPFYFILLFGRDLPAGSFILVGCTNLTSDPFL